MSRPRSSPASGAADRVIPDPDDNRAWIVEIDGVRHSWVDPEDPGRLEFDYMRRIADLIDTHADAGVRLRVVHVGGAAMSLARYVAHTRPTSSQIVLEPDAGLTAEVRERIPLPRNSGVKVRPVDGRTGLAQMPADYADIVIIDAFADGRVPADVVTVECFAEVRRVLHPSGLVAVNVTEGGRLGWTRRVLAGLTLYFPHAAVATEPGVLKGRRFGNLVLAGSRSELDLAELGRRSASAPFPHRWVAGAQLTSFIGGAQPFHDGSSEPSPPASGLFMKQ